MAAFLAVDQRVYGGRLMTCRFYAVEKFNDGVFDIELWVFIVIVRKFFLYYDLKDLIKNLKILNIFVHGSKNRFCKW